MARCSFDIHVKDILGILIVGASLVMLRPHGTLDFDYLRKVLQNKRITYMQSVPSLLFHLFDYIKRLSIKIRPLYLRSLVSGGMY